MKQTLNNDDLLKYVRNQIKYNFNDGVDVGIEIADIVSSLNRIEFCFNHINFKYFNENGANFNHLHGDAYSMFLYLLSREMYVRGEEAGATKIFLLNKMMFGIDLYFKVEMPDIFYLSHASGSVLGNAKYSDYLVVYQGVTVGSDVGVDGSAGAYPSFGKGSVLLANSTVIGRCDIGDNVTFGANAFLRNTNIGDNSIVVEQWPNHRLLKNSYTNYKYYYGK